MPLGCKMTEDLVYITNQSFREAGGSKEFPELKMDGVVFYEMTSGFVEKGVGRMDKSMEKSLQELSLKAQEKGYSHIFGLEVLNRKDTQHYVRFVLMGTGYSKKE